MASEQRHEHPAEAGGGSRRRLVLNDYAFPLRIDGRHGFGGG